MSSPSPASFAAYKPDAANWITLATGEYYPDILQDARVLYSPVLELFEQLLKASESSGRLFLQIAAVPSGWMRIQLCRVFKRYVSPATPVELLKKKSQAADIVAQSGSNFRPIQEVQAAFMLRPKPDEVLCALLWEYKDRGTKGYDLTERFFDLFQARFPTLSIAGPKRSGRDVLLGNIFPDYPKPDRPVDFIIYDTDGQTVLAIGLARYDSDRGGSQEGDRTGGYRDCVAEVRAYAVQRGLTKLKLVFLNDGPGLLLGLMWDRYAGIDESYSGLVRVMTLRMVPERLTYDWLTS